MEQKVTIRRSMEISTAGRTRISNLYARGTLSKDGQFRPVSCVGVSFVKKASALPSAEKRAA